MDKEIVPCSDLESKFVVGMWVLYGLGFIVSAVLWGIYKSNDINDASSQFETAVFFTLGVIFLAAFWYFKRKCDALAAVLLVFLPIFVIIFEAQNLDPMMVSPLSYGWKFAIPVWDKDKK